MLWDLVLKLILPNSVLASPMNSTRDPQKTQTQTISIISKLSLKVCLKTAYLAKTENFLLKIL